MEISAIEFSELLKSAVDCNSNTSMNDQETGGGRPVIVRSSEAGVIYGYYFERIGSTIKLSNARQLWRWKAREGGTLIDCAKYGVDPSKCKFSNAQATLTIFNACALIYCDQTAATSIEAVKESTWS